MSNINRLPLCNLDFCVSHFYRYNVFFQFIINIEKNFAVHIDFRNYFETWIVLILNAGRIDVIDQMYPRDLTNCDIDQSDYIKKYQIFSHVHFNYDRSSPSYHISGINLNDCGVAAIDNHIKQMLYANDTTTIFHYRQNYTYISGHDNKIDSNITYALYGGHFNLFLACLKYQGKHNIDIIIN